MGVTRQGHSFGVDFWACGILLHEMLTGMPPFYSDNPMQIYQKITTAKIEWQKIITKQARGVMQGLLERNTRLRTNSWAQLLKHEWFEGVDTEAILAGTAKAPWSPNLKKE